MQSVIHVVHVGVPEVAGAVLLGDGVVRGVIDSRDGAGVRDLAVAVLKSVHQSKFCSSVHYNFPRNGVRLRSETPSTCAAAPLRRR